MIYAVIGGSKGIGKCTVDILRADGHQVVDISRSGDIKADIGKPEGRKAAIDAVRQLFPDGIDGLVANAGIPGGIRGQTAADVISVNYFGCIAIIEGLYDLLEKKQGNVVVTTSASIAYGPRSKYNIDALLTSCDDEQRLREFAMELEEGGHSFLMYNSTKHALTRWVKRVASSWAARGVIINAVAPGGVDTDIIPNMKTGPLFDTVTMANPMPTVYKDRDLMTPESIAETIAFMVSPKARGNCGTVVYCDGGSSAIVNTEIYY